MRRKDLPWSVYALRDPNTGCIRYVGWATDPIARLRRHMKECLTGTTHKCRWLSSLGSSWPILQILESGVGDPALAEIKWIAEMKRRGCRLTNATSGGDGVIDPSPELRRLRSEINKGRRPSEETRAKLARAARNRRVKQSTREKLAALLKARYASAVDRHKLVEKMRGSRSQDFREMRRRIQSGKRPSLETRNKMSAAQHERQRRSRFCEGQLCLTLSL